MPPNIVDTPNPNEQEDENPSKAQERRGQLNTISQETGEAFPLQSKSEESDHLKTFMVTMNTIGHASIAIVVTLAFIFAINNPKPLTATPLHIILCVIGYQFLMAEAILSLSCSNGWSSHLRLVDKRRAHLVLQIMGSGLAIAGSFIKISDKAVNFNTLHGQFALVALVFTTVCLVNGFATLYAYELRRFIPSILSKLIHICFGTVAFAAACISLCYGFDKGGFRAWIHVNVAYTAIVATSLLCFIVITTPVVKFYRKSKDAIKQS